MAVKPNQQRVLLPGAFADVKLEPRGKLFLRSGTYFFSSLDVAPQASIYLDKANGPIFLYIQSSASFQGDLIDQGGAEGDFFVGYFGTPTAFIKSSFVGTFVAPNGKLDVGPGSHRGAFCAKDLDVHPNTIVSHLPFSSWPSLL